MGIGLTLFLFAIAAVAVSQAIRFHRASRDLRRDCEALKTELAEKEALLVQTNVRLRHRSADLEQAYSFLSAEIAERQQAEIELERIQNQRRGSHEPVVAKASAMGDLNRAAF